MEKKRNLPHCIPLCGYCVVAFRDQTTLLRDSSFFLVEYVIVNGGVISLWKIKIEKVELYLDLVR